MVARLGHSHRTISATAPRFRWRDAVRLMIVFSDNTATNLVLDKIGIASTGKRMAEWGCPTQDQTPKFSRAVPRRSTAERTKKFGLGSTTAAKAVQLLEKLHQSKIANPEACKEMIGHLKKCEDKRSSSASCQKSSRWPTRTGSVSDIKTDAGIFVFARRSGRRLCVDGPERGQAFSRRQRREYSHWQNRQGSARSFREEERWRNKSSASISFPTRLAQALPEVRRMR